VLICGIADAVDAVFQPKSAKIVRIQRPGLQLLNVLFEELELGLLNGA